MKEQFEKEVTNSLEADFKKIVELVPGKKGSIMYRSSVMPFVSGTINRIADEMTKYRVELNMNSRTEILSWVMRLAHPLEKKYFE